MDWLKWQEYAGYLTNPAGLPTLSAFPSFVEEFAGIVVAIRTDTTSRKFGNHRPYVRSHTVSWSSPRGWRRLRASKDLEMYVQYRSRSDGAFKIRKFRVGGDDSLVILHCIAVNQAGIDELAVIDASLEATGLLPNQQPSQRQEAFRHVHARPFTASGLYGLGGADPTDDDDEPHVVFARSSESVSKLAMDLDALNAVPGSASAVAPMVPSFAGFANASGHGAGGWGQHGEERLDIKPLNITLDLSYPAMAGVDAMPASSLFHVTDADSCESSNMILSLGSDVSSCSMSNSIAPLPVKLSNECPPLEHPNAFHGHAHGNGPFSAFPPMSANGNSPTSSCPFTDWHTFVDDDDNHGATTMALASPSAPQTPPGLATFVPSNDYLRF